MEAASRPVTRRGVPGQAQDLFAIAAILVCIALDALALTLGFDELDEGYFAEQASRVLRGEVPYRDFESLYTPGLLYLHAWAYATLGGPIVVALRVVGLVARASLALGMYALGRRLMPPFWAVLAPLFLLIGLDTVPAWEPHPGWHGALWTVITTLVLTWLPIVSPRRRWLVLVAAGVTAGVTFLFKQNAGAFVAVASGCMLLLQGQTIHATPVTPGLRRLQLLVVVGLIAAVGYLMRPFMSVEVAVLLLGPLIAVLGLLLRGGVSADDERDGLAQRIGPIMVFGAGFLAVTIPWLVMVVAPLEGRLDRVQAFVGRVDQSDLFYAFVLPEAGGWTILALGLVAVALVWARGWARVALVAAAACAVAMMLVLVGRPDEPSMQTLLLSPERATVGIASLLPPAAAAAGVWLARHVAGSTMGWWLRWYLVAGAFAWLTQYPRMDTVHLAWSAPVLLVVGGFALSRLHAWLAQRWHVSPLGRHALATALLVIPAAAMLPLLYLRGSGVFEADPESGLPRRLPMIQIDEGITGVSGMRMPAAMALQLIDVVEYVWENTSTDEPIFVYPSMPMLYVVTERPNPTRYGHVYPAIPVPEVDALVASLEENRVGLVVTSDAWLYFWEGLGRNPRVEAYLAENFREVAQFGVYRVYLRPEA